MCRLALVLGFSILSLVFAATASAVRPGVIESHQELSFDIDCGTFLLHEDVAVDERVVIFADDAGNPTRMEVHQRLVGVITNPSGETFRDAGHVTSFIDLSGTPDDPSDDTVTVAGLAFGVTVPGTGIIAHDTGLVTFNPDGSVVIHGPHEVLMQGFAALICPVLG
jgi:hypothetical protein